MTYREKNAWAGLVIAVLVMGGYVGYLLVGRDGRPVADVPYQAALLVAIGAGVVAAIVADVVAAASSGKDARRLDERDREIERFSQHVGHSLVVIGALAALLMALAEWQWFWIANTLAAGFFLSAVLESMARIAAYRKGFQPW